MHKNKTENITNEKRSEPRHAVQRDYRMEIKFVGEPIYQFRLINVTNEGASILIKDDSAFLKMIEVGQIADVADHNRQTAIKTRVRGVQKPSIFRPP